MKISPAAEFAVRGAVVLAENYGNGPTTLDSICKAQDLSKQYLVKIFASLARAGLVRPVRGKRGGYLLSREPSEINLLDLIQAVEGPVAVNFCQHDPPRCERTECGLRSMWADIQEFICNKLQSTTLGQCLDADDPDPVDQLN